MRLDPVRARRCFEHSDVARLATADIAAVPHLVPVTFTSSGDTICWAVDHKPKAHNQLRRLRNIVANPTVSLLVDRYDDDWSRLWWARADGAATILDTPDERWIALLADKYRQYRQRPPSGPMVLTHVTRWTGWAFSPSAFALTED